MVEKPKETDVRPQKGTKGCKEREENELRMKRWRDALRRVRVRPALRAALFLEFVHPQISRMATD